MDRQTLYALYILLIYIIVFSPVLISGWALVGAFRIPGGHWAATGHRKVLWVGAVLVATVTSIIGFGITVAYLIFVRPKLRAAGRALMPASVPPPP